MKDLSQEVENLNQKIDEKDCHIKAIDEKFSGLQKWVQEMYSHFVKKINESDQQHFNNVKIVDKQIGEVHEKLEKFVIEQTEIVKEQHDKPVKIAKTLVKYRDCEEIFNTKDTLKRQI